MLLPTPLGLVLVLLSVEQSDTFTAAEPKPTVIGTPLYHAAGVCFTARYIAFYPGSGQTVHAIVKQPHLGSA